MKKPQAILFAAAVVGGGLVLASPANAATGDFAAIANSKAHSVNVVGISRVSNDDAKTLAIDACHQLTGNSSDCKALAWGASPNCVVVVQDAEDDAAGGYGATIEAAVATAYEYAAKDNFPLAPNSPVLQKVCV